ncbi:MAG: hypothetical protein IPF75_14760 [Bacteroidetes bacterium]|nr:hypothetical protein [Bacteroidota bacterium]
MGNLEKLNEYPPAKVLSPVTCRITQIARAMHEAQVKAEEERSWRTTGEFSGLDRLEIENGQFVKWEKKHCCFQSRTIYAYS